MGVLGEMNDETAGGVNKRLTLAKSDSMACMGGQMVFVAEFCIGDDGGHFQVCL